LSRYDPRDCRTRDLERGNRDYRGRPSRPIEEVELHGHHVQHMWKRQPHRPDLLPPWSNAVDDSARDDQMSACIVVRERETEAPVEHRVSEPEGQRSGRPEEDGGPEAQPRTLATHAAATRCSGDSTKKRERTDE